MPWVHCTVPEHVFHVEFAPTCRTPWVDRALCGHSSASRTDARRSRSSQVAAGLATLPCLDTLLRAAGPSRPAGHARHASSWQRVCPTPQVRKPYVRELGQSGSMPADLALQRTQQRRCALRRCIAAARCEVARLDAAASTSQHRPVEIHCTDLGTLVDCVVLHAVIAISHCRACVLVCKNVHACNSHGQHCTVLGRISRTS